MNARLLLVLALMWTSTLVLLEAQAQAQVAAAPAASAPELTPNTSCGAGGTGDAMRYTAASPSRRVPIRETREASKAKPGELSSRVDANGIWQSCRMPDKAKDCQPMPPPEKWVGANKRECAAPIGAMLPARNISAVDVTIFSQGYFDAKPAPGQRKGSLTYECRPEGWTLIRKSCQ